MAAALSRHPRSPQWQGLVAGVLRKAGKDVEGTAAEKALSTPLEEGLRDGRRGLLGRLHPDPAVRALAPGLEQRIRDGELTATPAAERILKACGRP
ncbi:hypothetical protein [Streptomyces sp. NPDC002588]|uniref:hypothetical protein n=1 Tax=Streptomyces sp. NPDC002588 TaxID=3154419 RepID=UPI003322566D